jgi:carbon storage regulator
MYAAPELGVSAGSGRTAGLTQRNQRRAGRHSMLVLTRKSNQSIMIGNDIEVSVLAVMGEKVRIGIQAPRDIPVFRKEVYLEIQEEQLAAGKGVREEVDAALRGLGEGK